VRTNLWVAATAVETAGKWDDPLAGDSADWLAFDLAASSVVV
jgi:hypothetical protein